MTATTTQFLYTNVERPSVTSNMNLQQFAEAEFKGAPLTNHTHVRIPKRLSVFIETLALTEGVSQSTVFRYCLESGAAAQGYETQRGD